MKLYAKKILIILGIIILISLVLFGCTKIQKDSLSEDEERAKAEIIALEEGKQIEDNFNIVGNAIQTYEKNLKYLGCSDSDSGKNYEVYGEVTLKYSYRGRQTTQKFKDRCYKNNPLLEYYCNKNNLALAIYKCKNGCENGVCLKEKNIDMIVIVSPQYSSDNKISETLNNYSLAIKDDINWNVGIVRLSVENNTVGKIRDIIKQYYLNSNTKAVLILGEDIRMAQSNEFSDIDLPTTIVWQNLKNEIECDVYILNDSYPGFWQRKNFGKYEDRPIIYPNSTAQDIDNLLNLHEPTISIRPMDLWIASKPAVRPDVFVSLLLPLTGLSYEQKVLSIVNTLNKFSNNRGNISNSGETRIYVHEDMVNYLDQSLRNLGTSTYSENCVQCNIDLSNSYPALILSGHADPAAVYYSSNAGGYLLVKDLLSLHTPFFLAQGCNIGGWFSAHNPNGYIDPPEYSMNDYKMFMELVMNENDLRIVMLGEDDILGNYSEFVDSLNSGRTIAEAYLSGNRTLRHIFYGDPTFHYNK